MEDLFSISRRHDCFFKKVMRPIKRRLRSANEPTRGGIFLNPNAPSLKKQVSYLGHTAMPGKLLEAE